MLVFKPGALAQVARHPVSEFSLRGRGVLTPKRVFKRLKPFDDQRLEQRVVLGRPGQSVKAAGFSCARALCHIALFYQETVAR